VQRCAAGPDLNVRINRANPLIQGIHSCHYP
jgi:hypothetical protein